MSLMDMFKAKENEDLKSQLHIANTTIEKKTQEIKQLEDKISYLNTPELQNLQIVKDKINEANNQIIKCNQDIAGYEVRKQELLAQIQELNETINQKNKEIIQLDDEILLQEVGIYKPMYEFATSEMYKSKLDEIRDEQKFLVKDDGAVSYSSNWTINGSVEKGRKLIKDNVKQILRSFNNECDTVIGKVKFNNIDSIRQRIEKAYASLNKLNSVNAISINSSYLDLKLKELYLAYEYQIKKQEEKEIQKQLREEQREEARVQKELEEARKNIYKDQQHYNNALEKYKLQLESAKNDEIKLTLQEKISEIENQLTDLTTQLESVDYRQNNQKAGYVYIISNIGSFGDNVFKIGMTRRLEPMERVDELGDASVPFNFDVHAMIFTDDAPALENELHKAFEDKKINMVNSRREFFNVSLDEIENEVRKNYDKTVDFVKTPPAQQYRESISMRKTNLH